MKGFHRRLSLGSGDLLNSLGAEFYVTTAATGNDPRSSETNGQMCLAYSSSLKQLPWLTQVHSCPHHCSPVVVQHSTSASVNNVSTGLSEDKRVNHSSFLMQILPYFLDYKAHLKSINVPKNRQGALSTA